jgi:hypothetical protein
MTHNTLHSSASLLSWDYFSYSFLHSNVFGTPASPSPVGRDAGVQLRGLVVDNHLEYRVGLFQGKRREPGAEIGSQNMFRATGRVQVNVLDPETGFFYGGTYLGTKSVLSIGGTFDVQDDYQLFGGDVFVDLPVGPGVFTAQANFIAFDGGNWVNLPKATAFMSEVGFNFTDVHVAPIARFEMAMPDEGWKETRWALGAAYFPFGHNFNVKAFFGQRIVEDADHAANHFNLQTQVYVF